MSTGVAHEEEKLGGVCADPVHDFPKRNELPARLDISPPSGHPRKRLTICTNTTRSRSFGYP